MVTSSALSNVRVGMWNRINFEMGRGAYRTLPIEVRQWLVKRASVASLFPIMIAPELPCIRMALFYEDYQQLLHHLGQHDDEQLEHLGRS